MSISDGARFFVAQMGRSRYNRAGAGLARLLEGGTTQIMNKPVLVVMAAGMGSRYGGLKQLDPVGSHGELIIDYSIYDARRAGFETVVFVIKRELEETFRAAIGDRLSRAMDVKYAFQELADLPAGYAVPAERVKPWGTCHAVLAARRLVDGPFAVINADDYYGPEGFRKIYDYLSTHPDRPGCHEFAMVGYQVGNTVTAHGSVARGVCETDGEGYLVRVTEHTRVEKEGAHARFTEDGGATWIHLDGSALVSMNLWGFTRAFLDEVWARFPAFLDRTLAENPLKGEYFLPGVVTQLLEEGRARVKVLPSADRWHGVTYREDRPEVVAALADMAGQGLYPAPLWGA